MVFDKRLLGDDATLEWVTPGHPLFEAVRTDISDRVASDLLRGTVPLGCADEGPLPTRRLRGVYQGRPRRHASQEALRRAGGSQWDPDRSDSRLCFSICSSPQKGRSHRNCLHYPTARASRRSSWIRRLRPFQVEVSDQRTKENRIVREHIEISLQELINRQQFSLAELLNRRVAGESLPGLEGNIAQSENHLDELNAASRTTSS